MVDRISRASVSRVSTLTGVSESIRSRTQGAVTMIVSDCTEWPCTSLAAPEGCDGEAAAAAAVMDTRNADIVCPPTSFGRTRRDAVSCQRDLQSCVWYRAWHELYIRVVTQHF